MNKLITLSLVALMSVSAFSGEFPKEISQYLKLQESLSSDQELSSKELKTFLGSVKNLNDKRLFDAVEGLTTAKGIKEQRNAFALVSTLMIEHAKKNKIDGLFTAQCPMAMRGKGANWLQKSDQVKNPYYGSKMLKCGSVKPI